MFKKLLVKLLRKDENYNKIFTAVEMIRDVCVKHNWPYSTINGKEMIPPDVIEFKDLKDKFEQELKWIKDHNFKFQDGERCAFYIAVNDKDMEDFIKIMENKK